MVKEGVAPLAGRPCCQFSGDGLLETMTLLVEGEGVAEDKDPLVVLSDVPLDQWAYECRIESLGCSQVLVDISFQQGASFDGSRRKPGRYGFEESLPYAPVILARMEVLQSDAFP